MKITTTCPCCTSSHLAKTQAVLMPFVAHRVFGWQPAEITPAWGLNTVPSGRAFSLCNTLCCQDCGLIFLDMRFDDEEINSLYADYRGEAYTSLRDSYEPGYKERAQDLYAGLPHVPEIEAFLLPYLSTPIKVLDWGGDTGINTPFKNHDVDIYDISNAPIVHGVRVDSPSQDYDLIVCANVLEHVPYPKDLLLKIKAIMHPGTVLSLEVPLDDLSYLEKRHWHEHVNFFTPLAVEKLLLECGFTILGTRHLEVLSYHPYLVACRLEEV